MSNNFSCVGPCVRDAEVRLIPSGQAVLTVTIANNQGFGDKESVLFIRCSVWGKKAESKLIDYLKKGQQIFVSGELRQQEYVKEGVTKTSLELNCNIIDLVGKRSDDDSGSSQSARPAAARPAASQEKSRYDSFDNDIPF